MCKPCIDRAQEASWLSSSFKCLVIEKVSCCKTGCSDLTNDGLQVRLQACPSWLLADSTYGGVQSQASDMLAAVWVRKELFVRILQSCVFPSHPSHSEAAASTAPMPLKSPGFVISICTGYFHSMYLAHPVVLHQSLYIREEGVQ